MMDHLRVSDPDIFDAIISEARRQGDGLELIFCFPVSARGDGDRNDKQICRGSSC